MIDAEFDEFVRAHFAGLTRMGFLLCGDWHKAEDAAQEGLPRLHRRWRRVDDHLAWSRRVVARILVDEARRPWRREAPQDEIRLADLPDTADEVADRDLVARALQ